MRGIFTTIIFTLFTIYSSFGQVGELDPSFADGGILHLDITNSDFETGKAIVTQPDGKIVVGLSADYDPNALKYDVVVLRLNEDGSLDSTFAENGVYHLVNEGVSDHVYDMELLEDGKILVVGSYGNHLNDTEFLLVKLDIDGTPDTTFGTGGIVIQPIGFGFDYANGVAIDDHGKIIVAGRSGLPGSQFRTVNTLCRFEPDGMIDTTFGTDGIFTWGDSLTHDKLFDVKFADDGNLLVCGVAKPAGVERMSIYKVLEDGSGIDSTFATDGGILAPFEGAATGMIVHSNGNIVVSGYNFNNTTGWDLVTLAYNPDGTPAADFGQNGVFLFDNDLKDIGNAIIEQSDGKIIVAGESADSGLPGGGGAFLSVRLDENGDLDTSWGGAGYVVTSAPTSFFEFANAVAIQNDGKVLLTGPANNSGTGQDLQVLRYGNFIDADKDGFGVDQDCDDTNAAVNPDADEIPYNGVDDDCNPATLDDDLDEDGYPFVEDCDETNPDIFPGAVEIPDNDIDEDCDGMDLVPVFETILSRQFLVYPNPAKDLVNVQYDTNALKPEFIQIGDYTGRVIKTIKVALDKPLTTIDLKGLPQGLLILTVHTTEGIAVKRIVKS